MKAEGEPAWRRGPALPTGTDAYRFWFGEVFQRVDSRNFVAPILIAADSLGELADRYGRIKEFASEDERWILADFYDELYFGEADLRPADGPFEIVAFAPLGAEPRALEVEGVRAAGIPIPANLAARVRDRARPDFSLKKPASGRIRRIVALVDSDIAFANARFRNSDGSTRFGGFFDMDAIGFYWPGLPGRFMSRHDIDGYLARLDAFGYREAQLYLDYQADSYGEPWEALPAPSAGHGTAVLDAAIGGQVLDDDDDTMIVGVQLPRFAVALTHGYHLDLYVRIALHLIAFMGIRAWVANGGQYPEVLVNISVGGHAGRHDGLSRIEQSLDGWLRSALITGIFLPAGNSYGRRIHAQFHGAQLGAPESELIWRIRPDDGTSSFLEIWLPDNQAGQVGLHVALPTGQQRTFQPSELVPGAQFELADGSEILARLIVEEHPARDENGQDRTRQCLNLMVTRTSLRPPRFGSELPGRPDLAGDIRLRVTQGSIADEALLSLWISRDDEIFRLPTGARQSEFTAYSPGASHIINDGTMSDMGTGLLTTVCAAQRASDRMMTSYSGRGAPETATVAGRDVSPTASFVADQSEAHPGVTVAGFFSASTTLIRGTSVAAPQVMRRVLLDAVPAAPTLKARVEAQAQADEGAMGQLSNPVLPRPVADRFDYGDGRFASSDPGLGAAGSTDYPPRRKAST